jgi:hypothetical protein
MFGLPVRLANAEYRGGTLILLKLQTVVFAKTLVVYCDMFFMELVKLNSIVKVLNQTLLRKYLKTWKLAW